MKNLFILFAIFLLFSRCIEDVPSAVKAQLNQEVNLKPGQSVIIETNNEEMKEVVLKLVTIKDGRCPKGSNCFVAGSANIKISKKEDNYGSILDLCIGQCIPNYNFTQIDTTKFVYSNQNYLLILNSVVSHYDKKRSKTIEDYVSITVRKN